MSRTECVALFAQGHTVTEISRMFGCAKSTVSRHLKIAREGMPPKRDHRITYQARATSSKPCRYSPSCFTCPLADCVIDQDKAPSVNVI